MNEFYWSYQQTRFYGINWIPANFNRVMIIVHGIGEHTGRYDHVAEFFMQEGFAVIGIDHYGHGKSDGKRGASRGFEFMFDYLQAFLLHVKELYGKPVVMYGHSMGGGVLTGFLLRRNPALQAAVISAPALIVAMRPGAFFKGLLKTAAALLPDLRVKQGLDINKISHDKAAVEKFLHDPLRHDEMSLRLASDMIQNGAWCLLHAADLKVRSLLMHGGADEFTAVEGSRLFAQRAPAKLLTYREWDGMYHEIHNESNNRDVLVFMAGWLSSVR
ncbi:alpha-beta hydrolase superfamily lysophospholipase [Chitinophaga niastensis]|uniref:Alpha-beta hydrolase superfamily lysophospholipase n=1 Tax=Chitinophaga niastensis TaxID=536980 RepID=A0A2P8HJ32_CHINA|nr:alpha/beta hydrolase [Chitinophaga niastensis]PSL46222.1 alpha-beta hydrolase superfamily lysophospholipase [Chitinophaga niastensis]